MLTHIKKIKSFGVFDNYIAPAELPAFGRYNIVYGENGSGKTTLSRLLASLETGAHPDHPNLEFTVESQSGQFTNGKKYPRRIRVFNSDYIEANIGRFDGPFRHILILGEENKALAEELKMEILARDSRLKRIADCDAAITKLETDKGKIFSQIAKTIGEATSGSTLRSYRKPDAEGAFAKLKALGTLTDDELEIQRSTVRQEQMGSIGKLNMPGLPHEGSMVGVLDMATGLAARANKLTQRSAQSAVIERLAQNPTIAIWVEEGVRIHAAHSPDHCEFCDRSMPSDRLKALADHFSVEDQKLKDEIDAERIMIGKVLDALNRFILPDRMALYSELRSEYEIAVSIFEVELDHLKVRCEQIDEKLAEKLKLRTTAYGIDVDSGMETISAAFSAIDAIIERQESKTASFDAEKQKARSAIEAHYLLGVKAPVDEVATKIKDLQAEVTLLRDGGKELKEHGGERSIELLSQSILDKQAKVSNEHAGGASLTEHLRQFLGRTDLRFESGHDGYRVLRRGKPARSLSEGEKTAIAFLYFLVQLKDQDFELGEGIVVIDDPISSLDASAIYQAFSFLKNETQVYSGVQF